MRLYCAKSVLLIVCLLAANAGASPADSTLLGLSMPYNAPFAGIGRDLYTQPVIDIPDQGYGSFAVMLPALPAATMLLVAGFLCVSFIRDRRIWLAAVVAIVSLGNTGLNAAMRLASNSVSIAACSPIERGRDLSLDRFAAPAGFAQEDYIGLLYRIAGGSSGLSIPGLAASKNSPGIVSSCRLSRLFLPVYCIPASAQNWLDISKAGVFISEAVTILRVHAFAQYARSPPHMISR